MTLKLVLGSGEKLTAEELLDKAETPIGGTTPGGYKRVAKDKYVPVTGKKRPKREPVQKESEKPKTVTFTHPTHGKIIAKPGPVEAGRYQYRLYDDKNRYWMTVTGKQLEMMQAEKSTKKPTPQARTLEGRKAPKLKKGELTQAKAKKILKDGEVNGKPLTEQQKKFFGAIAGGETPLQKAERSLQAPKEWWEKTMKEVAATPKYKKYKKDRLRGIVGSIWADLDEKKKTEIRKRYGKEYGPAKEDTEKAQDPQSPEEEERMEAKKEEKKTSAPPLLPATKKSGIDDLASWSQVADQGFDPEEDNQMLKTTADTIILEKAKKDITPGESLAETSTEELTQTHQDIIARLKGEPKDAASLQSRRDAIAAELKKRAGKTDLSQKSDVAPPPADGEAGALQEELEKCMTVGGGRGRGILEWADQFYHTPWHVQALQCIKDKMECSRKQDKLWKEEVPYQDRRKWSGAKRGEYEAKQEKAREKIRKEEDTIRERMDTLESNLIDYRLDQEKAETKKSAVDELDDFAKAGPFIGPRGGKWADAKHTIPWEEKKPAKKPEPKKEPGIMGQTASALSKKPEEWLRGKRKEINDQMIVLNKQVEGKWATAPENLREKMLSLQDQRENLELAINLRGAREEKETKKSEEDTDMEKALPGKLTEPGKRKEEVLAEGARATPPKEYREAGATKRGDYGDPKNWKYPLKTEKQVRAAISYFSKPKNAGVYPVPEQKSIWGRIKRAAKKFKIQLSDKSGPPSVQKSEEEAMSGIDELAGYGQEPEEDLDKAQFMPEGDPKQKLGQGEEQGGKLAGVGETSGSNTSGGGPGQDPAGQVKVKKPGKDKLSDDEEEDEGQMKPHKKPIESARKSMAVPSNQRDLTAQEQAQAVSALKKGEEDVEAGKGPLTPPKEEPALEKGREGQQGMVHYSEASDLAAEKLLKSDEFYTGGSPKVVPLTRPIGVGKECPGCGAKLSKSLSACPECGLGTTVHRVVPGGEAQGDHDGKPIVKSRAGKLRPRIEKDVTIK